MKLRVAFVITWIACGGKAPPQRPPPLPVSAVALTPTEIAETSEYLAQLRATTAPALRPQINGQVTEILVRSGDVVEAGAPLMRIDPGPQPSAVAQVRAQRGGRAAALALAERNFARTRQLVERGAVARQELDDARAALDSARADVAALGAEIRGSQIQLGYYQITAPTRGVVGDIPVRVGDRVGPTTTVTSVTDNRVLEANLAIPVARAAEVALGTEVRLVDDAGNALGSGRVDFIAPDVAPDTQSVLVKATIDNGAGKLRADQVVRTRVVWRARPGIAVPALAVTWQGGQPFVFVVERAKGGAVARQRPVQLGELTDGTYPVLRGLQPGEQVVTGDLQKLRDRAPVAVRG
jgi:RND family efflux transporter MFP subunit